MDGWIGGWVEGRLNRRKDGLTNGCMLGWVWVDGLMDGWMTG